MLDAETALQPFLLKLGRWGSLIDPDRAFLKDAPWRLRHFKKGAELEQEGETSDTIFVLCGGLALTSKHLSNGAAQTVAMFLPGDVVSYETFGLGSSSASTMAVVPTDVLALSHDQFAELQNKSEGLRRAFWRDLSVMNLIRQEWLVALGCQKAYSRIAHLLCEYYVRMEYAGLATDGACPFPLTQHEFSNLAGLSVVHINRSLQQLRRDGLIELKSQRLKLQNWEALKTSAFFDPTYLTG